MDTSFQFPPEYKRELDLQQLATTLTLAEIRCLSWDELRPRLRSIWRDPQADEIILRVHEIELSERQAAELATEVSYLSLIAESLHERDRYRLDRRLIRLARALPQSLLYDCALADLGHRRKLRRVGAYKVLREVGISGELAPRMVSCYREIHDQNLLHLIARSPNAVRAVDVDWLLSELDEQYWRMRVIEGLIRTGDERTPRLLDSHPREFVHAVGRTQAAKHTDSIRALIRLQPSDWELLSLAAWAMGRLGDRAGLAEVRELLEQELASNPLRLLVEPGDIAHPGGI